MGGGGGVVEEERWGASRVVHVSSHSPRILSALLPLNWLHTIFF